MVVLSWGEKIRICFDLGDFNKVVKWEYYLIFIVEEIVVKIFEVKVFIVFDVKSGYF